MSSRRRSTRSTSRTQRTTISTFIVFVLVLIIYLFFPDLQRNDQPRSPNTAGRTATGQRAAGRTTTGQRAAGRTTTGQRADANVNLALGNPSGATHDPANADNYLIARDQYVLSYNRSGGIPNWVSWHLSRADMGDVERSEFQPDTSLPTGWYQVKPSDYTNSGYDRGHMAPSADRTATRQDNEALFLMTNIVPQAPDNNQGPWVQLEDYCRDLARQGNELYIVSGVTGTQATLPKGKVRVPARLWKVIVVLPEGDNDLQRINDRTTVIAVDMPNRQGIRNTDWQTYRTSVDQVEQATGYDLLSKVNPRVQAALEASVAAP